MLTDSVDRKSHSYLLGRAEAEIENYRDILACLVRYVRDDIDKLPESYGARRALDRARDRYYGANATAPDAVWNAPGAARLPESVDGIGGPELPQGQLYARRKVHAMKNREGPS